MNKYKFTISPNDKNLNIPIKIDFDTTGREDLLTAYENDVIEQVINPIEDFEVTRFSHKEWGSIGDKKTNIGYEFNFFDRSELITATTTSTPWVSRYDFVDSDILSVYSGMNFTNQELYYFANSFKRSFFKLDFYDSKNIENQTLYLTIIIPTQQGLTREVNIGTTTIPRNVQVKIPTFNLDFVGDKEGYFLYWLKDTTYLDISEFYMSCKFFNAKIGEFVRMINRPQGTIGNKFNFRKSEHFYYKVLLDYDNYEYEVYKTFGNQARIGTTEKIKWYEYVNP